MAPPSGRKRQDSTPDGLGHGDHGQAILVVSTDRHVLWANEAARLLLSKSDEPLTGLRCHEILRDRRQPCVQDDGCPLAHCTESGLSAPCPSPGLDDGAGRHAAVHPVPGPHGEVAEFVLSLTPPPGADGQQNDRHGRGHELSLLFTLTEMFNRGCTLQEIVELLARRLCRDLEFGLTAVYLPSRDARQLVMTSTIVQTGLRAPLERALGGGWPPSLSIPQHGKSLFWRAFRSRRATNVTSPRAISAALMEHAENPALRRILPGLQQVLGINAARLVPIRSHGEQVGLVLFTSHRDITRRQRERAKGIIDSVADLLRRTIARDERRQLQRQTAAILSSVQDGVLGLDTEGRLTFVNNSAARLLGWQSERVVGRTLLDLDTLPRSPSGQGGTDQDPIARAILSSQRLHQQEAVLRHRDGTELQVSFSVSPLEEDAEIRGVVLTFADISGRKRTEANLRRSLEHLRLSLSGTVMALGRMAEMRDPYTAGHQLRVSQLAQAIATRMGLPIDVIELVRLAALVHDIGKIGIPVELLTKPGTLAPHEFELIRTHTTVGWEILEQAHLHEAIADIARQHHERLDGSGYPDGLRGTQIRREARIIAVADTVEAMASHRPYRPARGADDALAEIFRQRGRHYDPEAVDACLHLFRVKGFEWQEPEHYHRER